MTQGYFIRYCAGYGLKTFSWTYGHLLIPKWKKLDRITKPAYFIAGWITLESILIDDAFLQLLFLFATYLNFSVIRKDINMFQTCTVIID